MMRIISRATRVITNAFMTVSGILIGFATLFATINAVVGFFSGRLAWAEELCSYCVVLLVYLAIPFLEFRGDQLCISAIDGVVKGSLGQTILNYIRGIITTGMMALLGYYGLSVTGKAFARAQKTYTLQIPKGYLYAVAAVCILVTVLVWLVIMLTRKGAFDDDN